MKLYRNIIIAVCALAVLVGSLVLVNNLPAKSDENTPNSQGENQEQITAEYIDILRIESGDIKSIDVKTDTESFNISKNDKKYTLSNSTGIKINEAQLQSFAGACTYVYADRLISENPDDATLYGFDSPRAVITISLNNGSSKTIYIGKETVDKSGSYIKISGNDNIYTKSAYGISTLMPTYNSFIDLNILVVNPTDYQKLTYVNILKKGNTPIELKAIDVDGASTWKMIKPAYADANGQVLSEKVLTPLESITATGVIEARAKDLSKYGLNSPYAVLSIGAEGASQKFIFGNEVDGYRFMMVDSYPTVYLTPASSNSYLDVAYIDLMSRLVHLENIRNVKKVEIKAPGVDFVMIIDGEKRSVNGTKMTKDDFATVYQTILGINFDSVDLNAKSGTPEATIKYTRNDGTTCTVSFVSVSDRNYLALVDGKGNSIVNKTTFNDAMKFIQQQVDAAK